MTQCHDKPRRSRNSCALVSRQTYEELVADVSWPHGTQAKVAQMRTARDWSSTGRLSLGPENPQSPLGHVLFFSPTMPDTLIALMRVSYGCLARRVPDMTTINTGSLGPGDQLERWQLQMAEVAMDITALDDLDVYRDIERGVAGNPPALSGESLRQALPLVRAVHVLFQQYSRLNDRVTRATSARTSVGSWLPGHPAMREVEQALSDPIELGPTDVLANQMDALLPVSRRPSIGSSPIRVAPATTVQVPPAVLLAALPRAIAAVGHDLEVFRVARDSTDATLTRARAILVGLERQAAVLGLGTLSELATVGARIEQLGRTASSDPLGSQSTFELDILPMLEKGNRLVKAAGAARADLDGRRAAARVALQQLTDAHRRSVEGWQNAARRAMIDPATLRAPAATEAQLADLDQWLDRLEAMIAAGAWREASSPLDAWLHTAQPLLAAESEAARINAAPLDQLELLRGRLLVLRTVAQSNGLGMIGAASSPALAAYRAAEQALMRPTPDARVDLALATLLVDRYAALVDPQSLPDSASDRPASP
jgi:hypothetical protein